MSQVFKVLEEIELDGNIVKAGTEVVCRAREAEKLLKQGKIVASNRELDPKDNKDAVLIAECNKRASDRHAEITGNEDERKQGKAERNEASDVLREEKVKKAVQMHNLITGEAESLAPFESMSDAELDKRIEEMSAHLPEEVEVAKYKIIGKAEYTDEFGNVQGELEIGSVQELPIEVGEKFVEEGVAEAYTEEVEAPKKRASHKVAK